MITPYGWVMLAQACACASCIMHLPAQYKCMPRGAERENGLSGRAAHRTHTDGWRRIRQAKENKNPQSYNVAGRKFGKQEKRSKNRKRIKTMNSGSKKEKSAEEKRGLAGLPVPPVSWDYLLLQSTVAQQKQREQQNYTLLPSQLFPHYLMQSCNSGP